MITENGRPILIFNRKNLRKQKIWGIIIAIFRMKGEYTMKKRILFLCSTLLMAALALTACGGNTEPESSEPAEESRQTVTVSKLEPASTAPEEEPVSSAAVDTENKTVEEGNIVVEYPQVRDLDGEKIQKEINRLVEADAKACLDKDLKASDGTGIVENAVIYHGNIMSVVSTGTITNEKGEQKEVVYTTNVDLTTGQRVSTGVRENGAAIAERILDGKLVLMETDNKKKDEIEAYLQKLGKKKLTALLEKCDFTEKDAKPKSFSYYMAEDSDEIGIYLPVSKKLGSYVILLENGELS